MVASRLIARNPEASIEQGARIAEAKSLIALGNPKSAYAQLMELREAVKLVDGRAVTEASGGITLESVRKIGETGVDWISVGALTHSAPALDLALDFD